MKTDFEAEYKRLNEAQRIAVDTIDGPLLVVAGPGTGKTQILSLRAANILKQSDADPENIICLTFTDKAALNMRQRLQKLIGNESRNIATKTFHAFAAEIMNTYPDNFWQGAKLSVAPDAVQLDIIESILAKLPLSSPLSANFAGNFTAISDVMQSLKLAKEAGLTPNQLRETMLANLKYLELIEPTLIEILSPTLSAKKLDQLVAEVEALPSQTTDNQITLMPLNEIILASLVEAVKLDEGTGKTANTGKWKSRWIQSISGEKSMQKERSRNEWWLNIADVYENYREILHKRGYYDYSDMLIEVLDQLPANPDMLADLQERYQYVMIDEFQDTNAAQLRLARQVSEHYSNNDRPNLMAVGDDDQSIFAFNGAELSNMLEFQSIYPSAKLVVLTDNYRSNQTVLDFSKRIIEQASDRLVSRQVKLNKNLQAKSEQTKKSMITHRSYPTSEHQYSELAEIISKQWHAGETNIAVLARKHDSLKQLSKFLLDKKIPIRYDQQTNVLEHEAVRQICLMAECIVAIKAGDKSNVNASLAQIVQHPMWEITPKLLWQISVDNFSYPNWLEYLLESPEDKLSKIANWLIWLARTSKDIPLALLFEYLIGLETGEYLTSPLRHYYLNNEHVTTEYLETISAINILRGLTVEFSDQSPRLDDFVRFINLHLSTGRVISDESWFNGGGEAVQLLTVYKAKGLEFEHVYILDLIERMWSPRTVGRGSPANLKLKSYGEKYDDYVRLLYVAATRAKTNITLTSYLYDDYGKEILPSPMIADLSTNIITPSETDSVQIVEDNLSWPRLQSSDELAILRERLEKYSLSPTALIDFLNLAEAGPGSFIERHLLHVPHPRSAIGSYGTAIHAALETAQRLINTSEKIELSTVLDRFEHSLVEQHLSPNDFIKYNKQGIELLNSLFSDYSKLINKGGLSEQQISDIRIGKSLINGKIDRIDSANNKLIISDYKTGSPLSSFETKDKTKMVKAWRHKTQLVFYALLVSQSPRFKKFADIATQMIYLEAPSSTKMFLQHFPSKDEMDRLTDLANIVWLKVQNLDFPSTKEYSQDIDGILAFEQDLLDGKI